MWWFIWAGTPPRGILNDVSSVKLKIVVTFGSVWSVPWTRSNLKCFYPFSSMNRHWMEDGSWCWMIIVCQRFVPANLLCNQIVSAGVNNLITAKTVSAFTKGSPASSSQARFEINRDCYYWDYAILSEAKIDMMIVINCSSMDHFEGLGYFRIYFTIVSQQLIERKREFTCVFFILA